VPGVQLRVDDLRSDSTFPQWFIDENGSVKPLRRLRLFCDVLIGRDPPTDPAGPFVYDPASDPRLRYPALLDTGAWLTIFPRRVWAEFEEQFTWLQLAPEELAGRPADQHSPRSAVLGHSFSYRLGRVWVGAYDWERRRLPAARVLAMFQEEDLPATEPRPILGLWAASSTAGTSNATSPSKPVTPSRRTSPCTASAGGCATTESRR
jgi:hypothetical protein